MNIQEFHQKSIARAKELAEKCGVTLKTPDTTDILAKATKRMELIAKYNERKGEYDAVLDKLLTLVSPSDLQSIIQKLLNKKN